MSTSILNVWITSLGDPCSIANDRGLPHAWVVAVSHCDGSVVNWSEARYRFHSDDAWTPVPQHVVAGGKEQGWWCDSIPTRDGHVEIELPPGCYVLRGTMHSWFSHGVLYGNWATDRAVVQACCGKETCATLYAPSAPACSIPLFEIVLPLLVREKVITQAQGKRVIDAMKEVFKPEDASPFEQNERRTLLGNFEQMGKGGGGSRPRTRKRG